MNHPLVGQETSRQARIAEAMIPLHALPNGEALDRTLAALCREHDVVHLRSEYLTPRNWTIVPIHAGLPALDGCVSVDLANRRCWHRGTEVTIPYHLLRLMHVFVTSPLRALSLAQCNQWALQEQWPQWTQETLRVAIHHVRKVFPNHFVSVRQIGYFFRPCDEEKFWEPRMPWSVDISEVGNP
ncbi:MAG: hypothetical protein C7B44_13290 [Sulfobacillus thermosulfidooxidans]|nr:MAG: hypothetical protein C7B44_13290 [Sulfobacillus thermosulfidooxidans]